MAVADKSDENWIAEVQRTGEFPLPATNSPISEVLKNISTGGSLGMQKEICEI